MRKINMIAVCSVLLYISPVLVSGQSLISKESAEIDDYEHEFFRPVPGSYVAINYAGTHGAFSANRNEKKTFVTGYDAKLNEAYSQPVKELAGNKYLGAIELNSKLHIFYADKKDVFSCVMDGANGQTTGNATAIFTATNKPTNFFKGFSPDSAYCFAAFACPPSKGKDQLFEGVIMDKKMNVRTKFSFPLEKVEPYIDNTSFVLSPEGVLFVINRIRIKSDKDDYRPLQYLLTEINKEGKTATTLLSDLPTGRISNLVWTNSKSGLAFTGLLSKTEKEAYTFILSGEFSSWTKKVTNLKEFALSSAAFWQQATGSALLDLKTRGISANAKMVNHFILPDGTLLLVLQPSETTVTFRGNYSYSDTYTGNVYILRIKPTRELEWMQIIPLGQREPTYPMYCGATATLYKGKELLILFHDYIKNTGPLPAENGSAVGLGSSWPSIQLTSFHVNEKGNLNRIKVVNNSTDEHRFSPHASTITYEDEIIYTSHHYRNLGKSTHKLGSIKIK